VSFHPGEINYWAVLAAGLLTFFIGGLWYTGLFGKQWVKLQGYSPEKIEDMRRRRPPAVFFGGMVVCYLVMAWVMALLLTAFPEPSARGGAMFGVLVWLGPVACNAMTTFISTDKPFGLVQIDQGYQLFHLVVMGAILGGWR
jgi:Protein of unknown function (DUF1761)